MPIATFFLWQNFVIQPFDDRCGFQRLPPPAFRAAANPNLFFGQWTVFERYGWAAAKSNRKPPDRLPRAVLMRPQVLSALLTTVLGAGAMFTLYTYISPVL
ncbi:MAG: hypothetical protein E6552_10940, partial [Sutterella wadsworthensis]|nr:hypothetical protein [Sutterella wadsworthensis]